MVAEFDLTFTVSGRDFVITAHAKGGQLWLFECTGAISAEDNGKVSVSIETEIEFERLYAKAVAGGFRVLRESSSA